jgi:hypothetical protein
MMITKQFPKAVLWLSFVNLGFGLLLFGFEFFSQNIDLLLTLVFIIALIALFFVSLIFLANYFTKIHWKSLIPLFTLGLISILAILLFNPIRILRRNVEFIYKRNGFEQVIRMIENGNLQPATYYDESGSGSVILPPEFSSLSNLGEISVDKSNNRTCVYFRTDFSIIFGENSSYVYCSNNAPPDIDIRLKIQQINANWYFVYYL